MTMHSCSAPASMNKKEKGLPTENSPLSFSKDTFGIRRFVKNIKSDLCTCISLDKMHVKAINAILVMLGPSLQKAISALLAFNGEVHRHWVGSAPVWMTPLLSANSLCLFNFITLSL